MFYLCFHCFSCAISCGTSFFVFQRLWVCFLKLFLRTVFENTKNTILVFFEICCCYLNLMFYVFFVFFGKKRLENQTCYLCFHCFSCGTSFFVFQRLWVCFLKLFLKTVFENTKNTILVFFEICCCYLNLVFYMFFVFFKRKKTWKPSMLSVFSLFFMCHFMWHIILCLSKVFENCS